ncbi:MAG: helix-turn-helix domain-containing protein [Planctomycetota bacterium]
MSRAPENVAVVVSEDAHAFEYACVAEVFGLHRPELDPWYVMRTCAAKKGDISTRLHVRLVATHTYKAIDQAWTVVVPGWRPSEPVPDELTRKLRRAQDEGARLVSVCTGAFALAGAGVLGSRRVTTHWRWSNLLSEMYPDLDVDPDVLYTDEDNVITSAGSAAGLDACLHLVRKDRGAEVANAIARSLVIPPHREGGQSQYIEAPIRRDEADDALSELLEHVRTRPTGCYTVPTLAKRVHMSPRTFVRRFKAATGTTPHRWLTLERVRLAQRLLETSDAPLESITQRSGFSDPQVLRLHFRRELGTSPTAYRKTFRSKEKK